MSLNRDGTVLIIEFRNLWTSNIGLAVMEMGLFIDLPVGGNVILSCGIGDYKFRGDIFWFQGSFVNSGFHSVGFSSLFTNSLDLKVFRDTFVFVFVSQMQFQRFFVRAFK